MELKKEIKAWFEDKPITKEAQELKFLEEVGETARAILKKDEKGIIDGFGDIYITLVGLEKFRKFPESSQWYLRNNYNTFFNVAELVRLELYPVSILALEKVALQNGYDLSYCIEVAWHEVKNRKGTMFNGSFVKDGNK